MASSLRSELVSRAAGDPFARITTDDHSATLWVVTLLSTIYAILVLLVRLGYTKRRAHALDDVIVTIAHLLAFGMWSLLWISLRSGLGKSFEILDDAEIMMVQRHFRTSRILLFIALVFSKSSMLVLIRGVFTHNCKVSILAFGTVAIVSIWGSLGVVAITAGCSVDEIIPKRGNDYCTNSIPWLKAVAVIDVATEVATICLPIIGFHSSPMAKGRKLIVVLAFLTRFPNIVFAVRHFFAYSRFVEDRLPALGIVPTVVWQSILLSFSLMSATTPLLKGFTQGFMTAGIALGYSREGTTTGGNGSSGNYQLRSLRRTESRANVPNGMPQDVTKPQVYDTSIQGNAKHKATRPKSSSTDKSQQYCESASIASHDSRRIMIKREWRVSGTRAV